ncbi:MAG: PAS domain S-box protein [Alphaproteobacteria bacterium]|nr:PAS domain S-box protein [Alphaproteobacteria bacterium]
MKIDYTNFILKHHKTPSSRHKPDENRKALNLAMVFSILALYFVVMVYVVHIAHVDSTTIIISILVFFTATLVAFAAKRYQTLQVSQEDELILLKEVLEGSRGGRLITSDSDQTLYYNQNFVEHVGAEANFNALLTMFEGNEEAKALFNTLSDQAHRGLTDSIELYCDKEKKEGWYQVSAQPVTGHPGYIHWRIDDITQRRMANRAAEEEREKLTDFIDNAPVGFFSVDEKGRFVFANATLARWLSEDLTVLLNSGKLHTYIENPPERAAPYDIIDGGGGKQITELTMKGQGGKTFLASINQGVVFDRDGHVRTRGVVHDLTSEREMHKALQASEDRFRRFYDEAPLGIVLVNQDGLIEDCNSEFARMMGQSTDELLKKHFKLLIDDSARDAVIDAMKAMQQGEQMEEALEVPLNGKNRKVTAQLHARRFKGSESIVLHFIDITDKKSLEEQFVQSQKMQAVGQLAGGIAHDFNNLLTAIIGFCDLLLLRHKPGDSSFGDIMQIKQNSNRAANLVRQLLAFSRQQTLRQRVHDITDILTELSHLLRRLIGSNIELEIVHGSDLGLVKVDEGQMEQVLINLAVNARDAMEGLGGNGKLVISTKNYTNKKKRKINNEDMPPGHWVLIEVEDNGCGISEENMGRILEPFFTTKDIGQGTGLGLSTVYGIIRQSDGFLDINSKTDKGTTFSIYLPRANEVEEEEEEKKSEVENITKDLTGSECILLVEDEDAVRTFSQRALVNKGYQVLTAVDGENAVEVFNEQEIDKVDLLITDVVMPGMDGPTLARKIRESSPNLKVIFMSGYTEEKLKDEMGERIWFLPKPFTLKQLAARVKEVLEE